MAQMPCLDCVSREWEQECDLREHLRHSKELLQWEDDGDQRISIRNADLNFFVLKPLAKRLRDDSGEVGMHCLPPIQSQKLGSRAFPNVVCYPEVP